MKQKYIGIILIAVGVALALWGYDVYSSAGSKISRAFTGDSPIEAWAGMAGGAVLVVVGVLRLK